MHSFFPIVQMLFPSRSPAYFDITQFAAQLKKVNDDEANDTVIIWTMFFLQRSKCAGY